ncbi:MAG: glycosyltransferase family 2 protein, partial [Actinomycetota bacterium]
ALYQQRQAARRLAYQPTISILLPVHNTNPVWLRAAIASVRNQTYPRWELCVVDDGSIKAETRAAVRGLRLLRGVKVARLDPGQGISGATNRALSMATGEFVGFLDHDDELKPNALFEVVSLLNRERDLDFIYSDEDKREPDGRLVNAFFKPDWSPEMLLAMNYVTHFSVYRRSIVEKVGGLRTGLDGSQDHDLALRVTEETDRIAHISLPLYTWRKIPGSAAASIEAKPWANTAGRRAVADAIKRRGIDGEVTPGLWRGSYRVRFAVPGNPRVAIIIPTRDRVDLLRTIVESIQSLSTYRNYELVVVDNQSTDPETLEYLETVKGRVIPYPHRFHYAAMMNEAAREARADYLVFLNNDTEVITPDWIEAMLEYAQQPEIGAVGARLRRRDGSIQHEGVVMGLAGTANNVDHHDYFGQGSAVLDVSAVTAACMMTRAGVYEELHGMEERLAVAFNDVDYCLRALAGGYRIVYTPYAELYHDESATRGSLHPPADEAFFRDRWGKPGEYIDAYYNPNLDDMRAFRIRTRPPGA